MAMIEHQLATHPAALACFRWDRVNLFQVLVYIFLYAPARLALALPIKFGDGGAGDFEDSLFSTADTDHPTRFLLGRDDLFLYLNAPLLDLDAMSFGSSSESHHQVSYREELVIGLGESESSCYRAGLAGEVADGMREPKRC